MKYYGIETTNGQYICHGIFKDSQSEYNKKKVKAFISYMKSVYKGKVPNNYAVFVSEYLPNHSYDEAASVINSDWRSWSKSYDAQHKNDTKFDITRPFKKKKKKK